MVFGTAAARAFDDAQDRQPPLVRHLLGHHRLLFDGGIRRAAAHREIVAAHDDGPAADAGAAEDAIGREEID